MNRACSVETTEEVSGGRRPLRLVMSLTAHFVCYTGAHPGSMAIASPRQAKAYQGISRMFAANRSQLGVDGLPLPRPTSPRRTSAPSATAISAFWRMSSTRVGHHFFPISRAQLTSFPRLRRGRLCRPPRKPRTLHRLRRPVIFSRMEGHLRGELFRPGSLH